MIASTASPLQTVLDAGMHMTINAWLALTLQRT